MKFVPRFELEGEEIVVVNRLKRELKEKTSLGVMRKAIAFLAEAVELAGDDGYFYLVSPDAKRIKIRIN